MARCFFRDLVAPAMITCHMSVLVARGQNDGNNSNWKQKEVQFDFRAEVLKSHFGVRIDSSNLIQK